MKIESASVLMRARHWSNAYYLAGYAIEIALKAVIARQISTDTIPKKDFILKIYTHDINQLRGLAGLKAEYDDTAKMDSLFAANWAICSEWSPDVRYEEKSSAEAHYILSAATDSKHGVLPWIMKYW